MRKLLLGVAACSLLLGIASCAKETVESQTGDGAMSFKAALGKQTRAQETTLTSLKAAQLDVYAYRTNATTLFNKFELTYDDDVNEWTYSPVQYQPGFLLRYYSVYPALASDPGVATAADPASGTPATSGVSNDDLTFDYTVKTATANQEDLIVASVGPTIDEEITLLYSHLLSQVNFAVQGIEDVSIDISNITVTDLKDENTYSFTNGWGTAVTSDSFAAYTYVPDATNKATLVAGDSADIVYLGNGGDTYTYDNALMLMPQTFTPGNAGSDGQFSFTFSLIVDTDNDGVFTDTATDPVGAVAKATNVPVVVNFGDFDKLEWEEGKRYVYVIDFTSYIAGGPITFKVNVTEWEDADTDTDTAQTIQVAAMTEADINEAIVLQAEAKADNTALKVFPINVTGSETVSIGHIYDFAAEDVIRLEFEDATAAGKFSLAATVRGWTVGGSGRVVTLTCVKPTIEGATVIADTSAAISNSDISNAIAAATTLLEATGNPSAYKEYTVRVGKVYAGTLPVPNGSYNTDDRIYLIFHGGMPSTNVTAPSGWSMTALPDGETFILTKIAE
jgi:hypothetical protein